MRAFDYHQPLRNAFGVACRTSVPDSERMKKFWEMAKNWSQNAYKVHSMKDGQPVADRRELIMEWQIKQKKRWLSKLVRW